MPGRLDCQHLLAVRLQLVGSTVAVGIPCADHGLSVLVSCALCAGHLTNLSELLRRNGKGGGPASPSYSSDYNNASASLERKSSIERSLDLGAATASLVLNMYMDGQHDGNEIIMLSELQVRLGLILSIAGCSEKGFAVQQMCYAQDVSRG